MTEAMIIAKELVDFLEKANNKDIDYRIATWYNKQKSKHFTLPNEADTLLTEYFKSKGVVFTNYKQQNTTVNSEDGIKATKLMLSVIKESIHE